MVLEEHNIKESSFKRLLKNSFFKAGYYAGIVSGFKLDFKNIFIFHRYQIGGAEFVHLKILESINSESLIVFLGDSENDGFLSEYKKLGTIWDFGKLSRTQYFYSLGKLASSLKHCKSELKIFGFAMKEYYLLVNCVRHCKHKVMDIIHAFNSIGVCPKKLIYRFDCRIVIDNNTYNHFKAYYKENNKTDLLKKVKLIYNYTDLPDVINKADNSRLKIIYVGRGTYEKRLHLVKQIAKKCKHENIPVEFLLVGPDKEEEDGSAALCYAGLVTDEKELRRIYECSDIILITSIREGFPMVLMEAMAYGTIPISTAVGGIPFHVKDGVTGFLVESTDDDTIVREFVECIKRLVYDKQLVDTLSANCQQYARENFSKVNFEKEYKRLFQEN